MGTPRDGSNFALLRYSNYYSFPWREKSAGQIGPPEEVYIAYIITKFSNHQFF